MAPIVPGLIRELHRRTRLARRDVRDATREELKVYSQSKGRARRDGIPFKLTNADFNLLVTRAGGRCEDTGQLFSEQKPTPGERRRQYIVSIDRLSASGPYSFLNCRLVLSSINISRNDLTLQAFHVHRLLYLVRLFGLGVVIPEKYVLRRGPNPEDWKF